MIPAMPSKRELPELYRLRRVNQLLLAATSDVAEAQMSRWVAPTAPSIKFHLWHIARWSDSVQARIPGMTPVLARRLGERAEIWEARLLADAWGLVRRDLGESSTGMGLSNDASASLPLPDGKTVRDSAGEVFRAIEEAASAVSARQAVLICTDWYNRQISVEGALQNHLSHANRHLGMIEALRGVLGVRGTATA